MELDVPRETETHYYGVVLSGTGKLWLDDVQLETIATATPTPSHPSLLTTPTPKPASAYRGQRVGGLVPLASGKIELVEGLAIFRMYSAAGPFSVELQDSGAQLVDRIFDEGGSFNGATVARIPRAGHYLLNVQATGAWTLQIEQPDLNDAGTRFAALPLTFAGRGKQVSSPFYMEWAPAKLHLVYDGTGPFNVVLIDQDGQSGLTIADFDGSIRGHLDDVFTSTPPSGHGNYLLYINAAGTYMITVDQ